MVQAAATNTVYDTQIFFNFDIQFIATFASEQAARDYASLLVACERCDRVELSPCLGGRCVSLTPAPYRYPTP